MGHIFTHAPREKMMKKILIRAGISPFIDIPVKEIIQFNRIGDNVGNLVYLYSVMRTLMTDDDVEIIPTYYRVNSLNAEEINEKYDAFVIPLADAIRNSFVGEMQGLTKLIRKLTIPCYVIGIGIRADFEHDKKGIKFAYDDVAYEFIKAVLEKSAMVGLRGEVTGDYLKSLGFTPEKDFTVIGCPSFYAYGKDLNVKDLELNENSRIAINNSVLAKKNIQEFLRNTCKKYRNYSYFPQRIDELKTLYLGYDYEHKTKNSLYPDNIRCDVYKEDRVKFYTHVYGWLKDLSTNSISIGPRLHGNVASVLAGTPALWIVHDARMKELAEYHNLSCVYAHDITEKDSIDTVLDRVDFKSVLKGHDLRFEHYVDFLNKNELPHIFDNYQNPEFAPFDKRLEELQVPEKDYSVKSVLKCEHQELIERFRDQYESLGINKSGIYCEEDDFQTEYDFMRENLLNTSKELNATKSELSKTKKHLEEATRSPGYLLRRKLARLVKGNK